MQLVSKKFVFCSTVLTQNQNWWFRPNVDYAKQFISLDIDNKQIITDNIIEFIDAYRHIETPVCYIPNISDLLINITGDGPTVGEYDGFFATKHEWPCIVFVDKYDTNKYHLDCLKDKYISNYNRKYMSNLPQPNTYAYCGKHHGLILDMTQNIGSSNNEDEYIYEQSLWQIPLETISDTDYELIKIYPRNELYAFWGKRRKEHYLEMLYLPSCGSIFAIDCFQHWKMNDMNSAYQKYGTRKCGLFDLEKQEWKELCPFEFDLIMKAMYENKCRNDMSFNCGITADFSESNIYITCNVGITAMYNFKKNKWVIKSLQDETDYKNISIWFDNYNSGILYGAFFDNDQFTLRYLDTSIEKHVKQWNRIQLQGTAYYGRQVVDIV
eukprot:545959_1